MKTPFIHIDMDAFFAAIEEHDRPELKGKPIIVGGTKGRGVVSTANYEARKYGVRSAMPAAEASRRCPNGIFLKPRFERYAEVSRQIMSLFRSFTPLVESLSFDEAYLDVRGNTLEIEDPVECAVLLKREILVQTGLTASAGVAPNKFVAKIASEQQKPDGLTVVRPEDIDRFLCPLPIRKIPGVGPATEARLLSKGIVTIEDMRNYPRSLLTQYLGSWGTILAERAWGRDPRRISTERRRKSMGAERTFAKDKIALEDLIQTLRSLCQTLSSRLEDRDLQARTLTLKIRYNTFETRTYQSPLAAPSRDPLELEAVARKLLTKSRAGLIPLRLMGLTASHFESESAQQLPFPLEEFLC